MGKAYLNQSQFWSILDRDWPVKAAAFLRGLYPAKTAERVADDLDVSENTVRKWLTRQCAPNGEAVLKMSFRYGPEFMAAVATGKFGWLSKAVIDARQERLEAEQGRLQAEQARLDLKRQELGLL